MTRSLPGRRERPSILGAVLLAIENESGRGEDVRLTAVAARANVAYDRLQSHLADLARQGLVADPRAPHLTPRGREFLRHYREWTALLDRFGLNTPRERPEAGLRRSPSETASSS